MTGSGLMFNKLIMMMWCQDNIHVHFTLCLNFWSNRVSKLFNIRIFDYFDV